MQKTCCTCRAAKPLADFHNNKASKDGLNSRCKACAIAAARVSHERKVRERNPEIDIVREHRQRLADARASGGALFTPLLPCPRGHLTVRSVASQSCLQCTKERKRSPDREPARIAKKQAQLRRKIALQNGQTYYFSAPCMNGHSGKRLVSTRQCTECLLARPTTRGNNKLSPEAARRHSAKRRRRAGRAAVRIYQKQVLNTRPEYLLKRFMYGALARLLRGPKTHKTPRTAEALGYTRDLLRQRIECQFKPGMGWHNYGDWHIDHKKPIAAFTKRGETRPSVVSALCNLQPLWAADNLSKSAKWQHAPLPTIAA